MRIKHFNKFTFIFKVIFLFAFTLCHAQFVYEPIDKDLYNFLDRLSTKGLIQLNDVMKPFPRSYIAEKLKVIESKSQNLTYLESQEFDFYKREYGYELTKLNTSSGKLQSLPVSSDNQETGTTVEKGKINIIGNDNYNRMRLFNYESDIFSLNLSPILGYKIGLMDSAKFSHQWSGISFYGLLGEHIGFSFDYRDNVESGDLIDRTKNFTPVTGVKRSLSDKDGFQYSEVHTVLGTSWSWGSFSIGKDFMQWGYEKSGNLVLSSKAPSFPFIRLDIYPVKWLHFNYLHGWLKSEVFDSTEFYKSFRNGIERKVFRDKFLASHTMTIIPSTGLSVSLGESIIYSDRLRIEYFQPLMFFRLADHYLSSNNNDAGDNSQFFFAISSRNHIPNTHLYGSAIIDEIALADIFDSQRKRNQVGISIGASVIDLPINNLELTLEYTRIQPFVYRHYIPTQTYESAGYVLGHWMGHNSDQLFVSMDYRIIRGLKANVWYRGIRKGGDGIVDMQYTRPSQPFLFGLNTDHTWWGFNIKYEFIHELFAELDYQSRSSSAEQTDGTIKDASVKEFSFALYYGL